MAQQATASYDMPEVQIAVMGCTQEKTQKEKRVYKSEQKLRTARIKHKEVKMVITRFEVKDKAKREALIDARLNDMGFDEREHGAELRTAAWQYYLGLIVDDLKNSEDILMNECLDSAEGMTLGFIAGYEVCLRNHL